ncbi:ankyrin repeat domain-containing protein [bacterium]|nr:ankyrin repeat domain-containing protein [bacterium]
MGLHQECFEGNLANVEKLLIDDADIEALETVDDDLMTPLLAAVRGNHPTVVMCLLKAADPDNVPSKFYSDCPLIHACDYGYKDIATMLMAAGADVDQEADDEGVNGYGERQTALLYALQGQHIEIAELLLAAGADKTHRSEDGHTPLWLAVMISSMKILKILLADPDVDVNVRPNMEESALQMACNNEDYEIAHALATDPRMDKNSYSYREYLKLALRVACGHGNVQMAHALARDPRMDKNSDSYREYTRICDVHKRRRERRMADQLERQTLPPGISRKHLKPNLLQHKTTLKF